MSVINLNDNGAFRLLVEMVKSSNAKTAEATNNAVAQIAADGRKKESLYEASKLAFRANTTKWYNGAEVNRGSRWDSKLGGYRAKTNALRLINFSWQNTANANKSLAKKFAKASVSSQTMNLWAYPTKAYSKSSPTFSADGGYKNRMWKAGASRPARLSFNTFESNVQSVIPTALGKVDAYWQKQLNKVAKQA